MEEKLDLLNKKIAEIASLNGIQALLDWDQQVNMPPGGVEDRSNQAALIGELIHHRSTSPELGQLIEDLAKEIGDLDAEDDAARIVRQAKRNYDLLTKIPVEKMVEFIKLTTQAHEVWVKARQTNDFSLYQPVLQRIIELKQEQANFYKPYDHIYDPLLDMFEPGMKTAEVQEIFATLRKEQVALLKEIAQAPQVDNSFIKENYNKDLQEKFSKHVISKFGYDWQRGRLDLAPHPFTTEFGHGDVRITTRYLDNDGLSALFSTMHEAGHAMYEQGLNPIYYTTSLAGGTSLAFHESQSRMWENLVGRSKEFWSFFYPSFQMLFPEHLEEVPFERFYKGINRVAPSLIRVEADEATYNLHIMLRMEIEIGLVEGSIQSKDLPEIWNAKMQEYLGITPPNDTLGVLQDVHWSGGLYGYFSTYALGNLISVQLWEKMLSDMPNMPDDMAKGEFSGILGWLRTNVHQFGSKYRPQELIQKITGNKISPEPYMRYLNQKYRQIYNI